MSEIPVDAETVLQRLRALRAHDAPTHGGRVLSYVYDSGLAALDELAAAAALEARAVNGLDPTTFPSVAAMESDLVAFGRTVLHGPGATGSVTSGGTESCLLAVLAARERWREQHPDEAARGARPLLVMPTTAHAAFRKAAHLFDLEVVAEPVDPATGTLPAEHLTRHLDEATALVVASAPAYPHGAVDPVPEIAAAAADRGVPCHVDACLGGLILPWWQQAGGGPVPGWDLAVPGVSSVSADLHKYGYAPKGASLLLFADPELDLARYFATTDWPGYPVVNPTLLGSRSAMSLAAAWAVVTALGPEGFLALTLRVVSATRSVRAVVEAVPGLRVLGAPVGPVLAVAADETAQPETRVDPHLWAAATARRGFVLQGQPALQQSDGTLVPRTTHLTVTPVTADVVDELGAALRDAADEVRGARSAGESLGAPAEEAVPDPVALARAARSGGDLDLTGVLALIEQLPREVSAGLLARFLAAFTAPRPD